MARAGITFEQVAAAADSLLGEGLPPTIRGVRERLGLSGSPNTIHRHLTAWREARPVAPAAVPELPPALTASISDELRRAAAAARGELEARLVQAQAEAAELAAAGEALEAERDALLDQVASLTRERDTQAGVTAQQAADLDEAQHRLEREQQAAEGARIELATARLRIDAQAERVKDQAAEIARLSDALAEARDGRIVAEQQAAVLAARLEAAADQLRRAEARTEEVAQEATRAAAAADAARTAAEQAVRQAQAERAHALAAAAEARERAARLEGQLAVAEARAAQAERGATEAAQLHEAARTAAEQAVRQAQAERAEALAAAAEARERAALLEGRLKALEEAGARETSAT